MQNRQIKKERPQSTMSIPTSSREYFYQERKGSAQISLQDLHMSTKPKACLYKQNVGLVPRPILYMNPRHHGDLAATQTSLLQGKQ